MIDLHTHTTASDGTFSPEELVKMAADLGLEAIAITDHDTTAGNTEAFTAGKAYNIEVVSGVEISADTHFGSQHIVGLFIDHNDENIEGTLKELREYRDQRNQKMIVRMQELGIDITMGELLTEAGGDLVGRPHFANLLVKKGVVKSYQDAFNKYLKAGGEAYLDKKRLSSEDAIKMIHDAGGISIIAHPYLLKEKDEPNFEKNVAYLVNQGIQGIEVFYTEHSDGDEALYADIARKYDLYISGGTDFHGTAKPDIILGRGYGSMNIPYDYLEAMKESMI